MRFIKLNTDDIVVSIRIGKFIADGEIQSDVGEIGQKLVDGEFVDVPEEFIKQQPTLEERIQDLQDDIDYLILKQEGII